MTFQDWFDNKLTVSRYPLPQEIKKSDAKYVINVSDEYISSCHKVCMDNDVRYFWFPMDEVSCDIGVNSIFGAMQILWIAEQEGAQVILHCHAGANRSPTVMEAYYFMRTKKHIIRKQSENSKELFKKLFPDSNISDSQNNMLLNNIEGGHLPAKNKMETFLQSIENWFKKQDWENDYKTESGLQMSKVDARM